MSDDTPSPLNNVITIDDERIKSHLDRVVRGTVEETLNALLDAEADRLCNAQRYERSDRASRYPRRPLRARAADQGRRGTVEGTEAAPADVRDGYHRAPSAARELGGGGADRDVSGRGIGAPGRGHHGGIMGHASVALDGVGLKQEDLRDDRGLAQSSDRGRAPVCLSRWHRAQAQLGRRGAQRLAAGCDRREREWLSGDSRHLRGGEGGQEWLERVPQASQGTRVEGRPAHHLGCLHWA